MSNAQGNNGGRTYSFLNRPVLVDCSFTIDSTNTNGLGIKNLTGSGIKNVYMYTSQTPATGNPMGQNASKGYALIQLANNYNRYAGGFTGFVSPTTGSAKNIDASDAALTVGTPYVITSVGHAVAGAASIVTVADSSGSLASTYFRLPDAYGNTFIIWMYVTGVGGSAPTGVSGTLVQCTIAQNAANTAVASALSGVIGLLPSGISGVYSFTTGVGGHTVTCTNTSTNPYQLPGPPADGAIPTGFTLSLSVDDNNDADWRGVGLPPGIPAAIGASFIATATGSGSSTGQVKAATVSAISSIEVIGDPNKTLSPRPLGSTPHVGGWILVQFLAPATSAVTSALTMASYTPAGTNDSGTPPLFTGTPAVLTGTIVNSGGATTLVPTQPANGSVVSLSFMMSLSSTLIKGE